MTEENTRTGANEADALTGNESKKAQVAKPKRKYRRAEPSSAPPSAFVQIDCGRKDVTTPRAPDLPDPRWTAEFVVALFSGRR